MKDRKTFIQEFFPKWSGFCVDDSVDFNIEPVEALQQLQRLVEDISEVRTIDATGSARTFSVGHKLNISEVSATSSATRYS